LRALRRLTDHLHPEPALLDGRPVAAVASVRFADPARDRRSAGYWEAAPAPRTRTVVGRFDVTVFDDGSALAGLALHDGTERIVLPSRPFVGTPDATALERLWKPAPRVSTTTRFVTWQDAQAFLPDACRLLLPIGSAHLPTYTDAQKAWASFCGQLQDLFPGLPDTVRLYGAWAGGGLRCAFTDPRTHTTFYQAPDGLLAGIEAQARTLFPGLLGFCQRWNPHTDIGRDPREQAFSFSVRTGGGTPLTAHERLHRLRLLNTLAQVT
jgi:hypothetical protein